MTWGRPGAREVVIRDPLWQNIVLEPAAAAIVDTPAFQRLRYVRQLGHAFLVYPGASHTRFEHALGTYALARRAIAMLRERGRLGGTDEKDLQRIRLGALLHDIGHYPFSHTLEESGLASHEDLAQALLAESPLRDMLVASGVADPPAEFGALIRGTSAHPLAGLVSGSLDLDKIDYLKRDALMCGVPYGEVDVDRLLATLTVVPTGRGARIGIHEKGLAALESLLFAKYQMYRNVYWHHAVRSATAMFKRLVHEAVADRVLETTVLADTTDDWLLHDLLAGDRTGIAQALRERRLYKRALEVVPADLAVPAPPWLRGDPQRLAAAENALARRVGLGPAELLIDLPHKAAMLDLDLPVIGADGRTGFLTSDAGAERAPPGAPGTAGAEGPPAAMPLVPIAARLAESACRLRVFTRRPAEVSREVLEETLAS